MRRLISSCSRHLRSASSPAQDDLDDAELIDEFSASESALGFMIRNRGKQEKRLPQLRPMSAQEERRAQEREKTAQKLAEKKALDQLIAACGQVQSGVAKFDRMLQANVEIYVDVKYAALQNELASHSEQLAQVKEELHSLEEKLSHVGFLLRRLAIEEMALESAQSVRRLAVEFRRDILRPRVAARRAIDQLLKPYISDAQSYSDMQKIDRDLSQNLNDMQLILGSMKSSPDIRTVKIYKLVRSLKVVERMWDLLTIAHQYRSFRRQRENTEGPLGDACILELFRSCGAFNPDRMEPFPSLKKTIEALVPDWDKQARPKFSGMSSVDAPNGPLLQTRLLWNFYVRRWEEPVPPPRSPLLNIFWRHIDIIAPVEIALTHGQMLSQELHLLIESLTYPLPESWSGLSRPARLRYCRTIRVTNHKLDMCRTEMKTEYNALRYISWARLQTESRLHHLGLIAPTIQSGLFTPAHALSQNLRRFRDWVVDYTDCVLASTVVSQLRAVQGIKFWSHELSQNGSLSAESRAHARHRLLRWTERYFNSLTLNARRETRRMARRRLLGSMRRESKASLTSKPKGNKDSSKTSTTTMVKTEGYSSSNSELATTNEGATNKKRSTVRALRRRNSETKEKIGVVSAEQSEKPSTTSQELKISRKSEESGQPDSQSTPPNSPVKRNPSPPKPKATDVAQAQNNIGKQGEGHQTDDAARQATATSRTKRTRRKHKAASSASLNQSRRYSTRTGTLGEEQSALELPPAGMEAPSRPEPLYTSRFWSHKLHKTSGGKDVTVHYCTSLETAERVASKFLSSEIVGFDIEWRAQSAGTDSVTDNVSLIQLANEERIALFHLAVFRPGRAVEQLVPPSLRKVLESPDIIKAGVSIKADCTRVRRYLGMNVRSQFELSHLYKLVKYAGSNPGLINRRVVNLSQQVEEHFGLPLDKDDDVRCGDWSQILTDDQIHCTYASASPRESFPRANNCSADAAADPYACFCLYTIMESKRKALNPVPPRPAFAEFNLPIAIAERETAVVSERDEVVEVERQEASTLSDPPPAATRA